MRFRTLIGVCALALCLPFAVLAERVALVIGNSAYQNASPLPNAATDAGDVAARLTELGFAVYSGIDLNRAETLALVDEFANALQADDLALFYYAGHGAQIGTENYVVPIDATATDEVALTEASVRLQAILTTMERRADRRIVILDACRNNPFVEKLASRAVGGNGVARGLAKVEAGVGSYIAFSTQPGNVALDGNGRNSPFTAALLRHVGASGDDIHAVMRKVRGDVVAQTNQMQVPWENSSLVDEVFLAGTAVPVVAPAAAPAASKAQINRPKAAEVTLAPSAPSGMVAVGRYYVGGLDPNGDGFLPLQAEPRTDAAEVLRMPEGTALNVTGMGDPWWQVETLEGAKGYAHADWIQCCKDVMVPIGSAPDAVARDGAISLAPEPAKPAILADLSGQSCDALWMARNLIWHDYGYCFTTERAVRAFGNDSCVRGLDRAAIALSDADRDQVNQIAAQEAALGCN